MTLTPRSSIVVGLDGSASAAAALDLAVDLAQRRKAPLRLVHAIDPTGWEGRWQDLTPPAEVQREAARSLLTTLLGELEDVDLDVDTHIGTGPAASVLLEQAQDAQMVVVGSRGNGEFVSLLLGSTSLKVAMHAPCPVVVARPVAPDAHDARSAGRVVVGVDGSELSEAAVAFAFEEADLRRTGITALHAWMPPSTIGTAATQQFVDAAEQDERALLSERLAGWSERFPDVPVVQRVRRADPVVALVEESAGAALTIVGSRGAGGFRGLLLGSVSHAVLHHAGSPVAIVRTVS